MQKKTTTMTGSGVRDSLPGGGSDPSLHDLKGGSDDLAIIMVESENLEKSGNSNTLPHQNSSRDSKTNGSTKSVKFSTLPSPNKGVFNNNHV